MLHRMNQGYIVWGVLKSVPSNRGVGIEAKSLNMKELLYQRHCKKQSVERRKVNVLDGI